MQSLLQKIHIYGGLSCFWYLIVLGVSSLQFNHHFKFMQPQVDSLVWERQVKMNNAQDELRLSEAIRDSLSLMGWPLPWEMSRDSTALRFAMEQPAKRYFITYTFDKNIASVVESRKGFWRVFNSLHGSGYVPNGSFTTAWQGYTRITAIAGILSIISGIYIWITGKEGKRSGLIILAVSLAIALGWMIKIYFVG